ncbi:MAG: hypothetical protein U0Y68_09830 [Blastocatellia bacterium]
MSDLRIENLALPPQDVDPQYEPIRPGTNPSISPELPGGTTTEQSGTTQNRGPLMPDAVTGRDPSQLIAAEHLRTTGGASATDILLGLNLFPTKLGAFPAPPGNQEALRYLSPARRRAIIRSLLDKQRERMRKLSLLVQMDEEEKKRRQPRHEAAAPQEAMTNRQTQRASRELDSVADLLELLEEMLMMQDYTLAQMGTFSKG